MPPWLTDPEGVAAFAAALFTLLSLIVGGLLAAVAGVIAVWRAKVKPLLTTTQDAAQVAAHESRPNSGKSMRDAIDQQGDLLIEVLAQMRSRDETSERVHSEMFRRIYNLESRKDTTP
ncbi:hypothetical protein [Brachybacterium sp. YJGR34]|uniref:hypothetical protein n=1 Tax=Brachybacterium sp. YJGR34 TaxID=2059911 RepID=UPI000E0A6D85|nr:hypothetical protein [Brachybacterium sp. YJGR34]